MKLQYRIILFALICCVTNYYGAKQLPYRGASRIMPNPTTNQELLFGSILYYSLIQSSALIAFHDAFLENDFDTADIAEHLKEVTLSAAINLIQKAS